MTGNENGWLEAAIAWEVCASLHRQYCKGKDGLFTTRQSDFVKHAEAARLKATAAPQPSPAAQGDALDAAFEAVRKRLCKLSRYSFALDSRSNLRRCEDKSGNWIEFDAVHALFDPVAIDAARAAQEGK